MLNWLSWVPKVSPCHMPASPYHEPWSISCCLLGLKEMILLFTGRTSSFESSQPSCYFKLLMGMSQIFGYAHHSQPNGGPKKTHLPTEKHIINSMGFFKTRSENETLRSRGQKTHISKTIWNEQTPRKTHQIPPQTSSKTIENQHKDHQKPPKIVNNHQKPSKIITSGRHSLQETIVPRWHLPQIASPAAMALRHIICAWETNIHNIYSIFLKNHHGQNHHMSYV